VEHHQLRHQAQHRRGRQAERGKFLFNFQELNTDGYLTNSGAQAYNQAGARRRPHRRDLEADRAGDLEPDQGLYNDSTGATLLQTGLFGKNFGLTKDPSLPTYYKYNVVRKHTYFNYAKIDGDVTDTLKLDNTLYSYYYKNDTESALDVTLSPTTSPPGPAWPSRKSLAASRSRTATCPLHQAQRLQDLRRPSCG